MLYNEHYPHIRLGSVPILRIAIPRHGALWVGEFGRRLAATGDCMGRVQELINGLDAGEGAGGGGCNVCVVVSMGCQVLTSIIGDFGNNEASTYRVFSRHVAWLVVTMETVGQTNQSCVTTGSPPNLTIRLC